MVTEKDFKQTIKKIWFKNKNEFGMMNYKELSDKTTTRLKITEKNFLSMMKELRKKRSLNYNLIGGRKGYRIKINEG